MLQSQIGTLQSLSRAKNRLELYNIFIIFIYLVSVCDEARSSFRQDAPHSEEKGTLQLDLTLCIR